MASVHNAARAIIARPAAVVPHRGRDPRLVRALSNVNRGRTPLRQTAGHLTGKIQN